MSEYSKSAKIVTKIGVVATIIFMMFFIVEEWGFWYVPTINMVLFGVIVSLLGILGQVAAKIQEIEESIVTHAKRTEEP